MKETALKRHEKHLSLTFLKFKLPEEAYSFEWSSCFSQNCKYHSCKIAASQASFIFANQNLPYPTDSTLASTSPTQHRGGSIA